MKPSLPPFALALICAIVLPACDHGKDTSAKYAAPAPGVIKNANFTDVTAGKLNHWALLQHAGNKSYELSVADSILTITRTGTEPWGKLRQILTKEDVAPLMGRTLRFSADIKTMFSNNDSSMIAEPALKILVKGLKKGTPAMLGRSSVLSEKTPIPTAVGETPWQRIAVTFTLPEDGEIQNVDLEVAFLMTMWGQLQIRAPSLVVVEPAAAQ